MIASHSCRLSAMGFSRNTCLPLDAAKQRQGLVRKGRCRDDDGVEGHTLQRLLQAVKAGVDVEFRRRGLQHFGDWIHQGNHVPAGHVARD